MVVGNPRNETVTMGALVSLHQRDEVRDAVAALERATEIVYGDPMSVDPVDADPERGAFMAPLVLLATGDRSEPHEIEAFGPVTTLIPYAAPVDLGAVAARGGGSLVGSIVSYDPDFVRDVVAGAAPYHGRLLILDRDCAGSHRARHADAATGARPPRPSRWWRGARRHARGQALHAAHRCAGVAGGDRRTARRRLIPGARPAARPVNSRANVPARRGGTACALR